jgi:hypothetical protein
MKGIRSKGIISNETHDVLSPAYIRACVDSGTLSPIHPKYIVNVTLSTRNEIDMNFDQVCMFS